MCYWWSYLILYFPSLPYFHQWGMTPLIYAAQYGHFEVTKLLLEAGADVGAKSNVSKTIFILSYIYVCVCVCVCVCVWWSLFFHHTVWYDNVIIMNNFTIMMIIVLVFVFVLMIITSVLLFYLINMMISIVNILLFMIFL